MESLTVEHTYGQALFDAALDLGKIEKIGEEYKIVTRIFADEPLLKKLFLVPTLSALEKKDAAGEVFGDSISKELLNFIFILIDKRRIGSWERIGRHYEKLVWERDGLTKGILYTVLPVDETQLRGFEARTSATIGKTVKLENRIDKSFLGGAKIYVDGKLIDVSVKTRLENMKKRIRT